MSLLLKETVVLARLHEAPQVLTKLFYLFFLSVLYRRCYSCLAYFICYTTTGGGSSAGNTVRRSSPSRMTEKYLKNQTNKQNNWLFVPHSELKSGSARVGSDHFVKLAFCSAGYVTPAYSKLTAPLLCHIEALRCSVYFNN